MFWRNQKHKLKIVAVVVLLLAIISPTSISARTIDDIQQEIGQQNQSLTNAQNELKKAEQNLKNITSQLSSSQGEIPRLENEIKQIQAQLEVNKLKIAETEEVKKLKELETEERQVRQVDAIKSAYQQWRSRGAVDETLMRGPEMQIKYQVYQAAVSGKELGEIEELVDEVGQLKTDLDNLQISSADLEKQNGELTQRKTQLEAQIAALRSSQNAAGGSVAGLRGQVASIQSRISQLSAEQKALQDYEAWLLGQSGNGGTNALSSGQIYFTGRGRDLLQGHGVGFSQWGAYGGAGRGMTAAQLINHYYTGVQIQTISGNVNVTGYGTMNLNDYVAGQGEIPIKACGTAAQVASNPAKYMIDNTSTVWDCWPEEAIKAQAIIYRTYALHWMQNYGGSICTNAGCQVYNGTRSTSWAAEETRDQVITYNGRVIEALYSSDNNNGWGTANNETVFSTVDGSGTPVPYLRAVNDNSFAFKPGWNNWTWRTNGYTLNDGANSIKSMLNFASTDTGLSSYQRSYIAGINSQVGAIAALNFDRDPSGRVSKVRITGTNGRTVVMAGWLFKGAWNSWVDKTQPTGQKDFIYSLTYFLLTA